MSTIDKADKHLAEWQSNLLNPMGCFVLLNSVLDGHVNYIMGVVRPPVAFTRIEKKRRGFLWDSSEQANGSKSLVP
jgi:hypothetical protein